MRVLFTHQSLNSLEEAIKFMVEEQGIPLSEALAIQRGLIKKTDELILNPFLGQSEEYLEHLEKGHRRLIDGHFKIIYRVESSTVYITDFFDSRQDPSKMKG